MEKQKQIAKEKLSKVQSLNQRRIVQCYLCSLFSACTCEEWCYILITVFLDTKIKVEKSCSERIQRVLTIKSRTVNLHTQVPSSFQSALYDNALFWSDWEQAVSTVLSSMNCANLCYQLAAWNISTDVPGKQASSLKMCARAVVSLSLLKSD